MTEVKLSITPLPLVAKHDSGNQRVYDLEYELAESDAGKSVVLDITVEGDQSFRFELQQAISGKNKAEVRLPDYKHPTRQLWSLSVGESSVQSNIEVPPVRHWNLHISLHSHTDLGFTETIAKVAEIHADNTDQAMLLMDETTDWPLESRFRWTIEITWQLEQYIKLRGPEAVTKLQKYLKSGQMELAAMYAGEHVDALGHEEAVRTFYLAAKYRRELGIPVETAMLCDVPGSTEGLVQIMAKSGIKNFIIADNNFCAPILKRTDLPRPFDWQSTSGDEVTTWYTDHPFFAYMEGRHYGISESVNEARKKLPYRLLEQEAAGYAHNLLHVQYAFDNFRLEFRPALVVREWNETWEWPKLELSTPRRFFNALRESGAEIPKRKGDLTEWWTSTFNQYPVESAISKRLHDQIPSVESLQTLFGLNSEQEHVQNDTFEDIYHKLLAWDEHSGNGQIWAAEDPEDEIQALEQGYGLIYDAQEQTNLQLKKLESIMSQSFTPESDHAIVIANSLTWARGGRTSLSGLAKESEFCLFSHNDTPISHGITSNHEGVAAFQSPEIPALGYRTFIFKPRELCGCSNSVLAASNILVNQTDQMIELVSDHLQLKIDVSTGALFHLQSKADGKVIHSSNQTTALGDVEFWESHLPDPVEMGRYIRSYYEGVPGKPVRLDLPTECTQEVNVIQSSDMDPKIEISHRYLDTPWLTQSIRLDPSGKRLILDYTFHHKGLMESGLLDQIAHTPKFPSMMYIALPTTLDNPRFRYEATGMSLEAGDNQMKGSNHDFYAVHRWAMLQDAEHALAVYPSDSLIVDPGQPSLNTYRSEISEDNSALYFRIMPSASWKERKWGMGYYDQDHHLHFELEAFKGNDPFKSQTLAQTQGTELSTNLIATKLDSASQGTLKLGIGEFLHCEGQGLEVMTIKPAEENSEDLIVRVRETLGSESQGMLAISDLGYKAVADCQLTEEVLGWCDLSSAGNVTINFQPFEIRTLRLTHSKTSGNSV